MSKPENILIARLIALGMRYTRALAIFAIVLPLIFFGGSIAYHIQHKETAQSWRIDLEGYDPRDLLKGRYIQYRFAWNAKNSLSCDMFEKDCCLCLTDTNGTRINPEANFTPCRLASKQCDAVIKGESKNGIIDIGLNRYYVDERVATPLDRLLRRGEVRFAVDLLVTPRKGSKVYIERAPKLGELYVNGTALSELRQTGALSSDKR